MASGADEGPTHRWDRRDASKAFLTSDANRTPLEECDEFLDTLRREAGVHKRRAHAANLVIVGASGAIPVLLLLSTQYLDFYLGKLVPALLAALATGMALLLQLMKPHERWRLLRLQQALLEDERFRYLHQIDGYSDGDRDAKLFKSTVAIHKRVEYIWSELMPESAQAAQILQSGER